MKYLYLDNKKADRKTAASQKAGFRVSKTVLL